MDFCWNEFKRDFGIAAIENALRITAERWLIEIPALFPFPSVRGDKTADKRRWPLCVHSYISAIFWDYQFSRSINKLNGPEQKARHLIRYCYIIILTDKKLKKKTM